MQGDQDCKGWLLTCDQHRQRQALKDAYNFLTMYIEQVYDDLVSEKIQKKLKQQNKELSLETELKQSKKKEHRLLFSIETHVKCVIFVKINPVYKQIDPVLIVDKIMKDVYLRNKQITRYCHKVLPVERAFKANHFKMLDVVDQLFNEKTQPNEIKSWSLNFKLRNNSKFNYKEVLRECDKIASKYGHFADIYYPQWTVSIQIANHLMCICISDKFKEYNEYKLHKAIPKDQRTSREGKPKEESENEEKQERQDIGLRGQKELRQLLAKQKEAKNVLGQQSNEQVKQIKQQAKDKSSEAKDTEKQQTNNIESNQNTIQAQKKLLEQKNIVKLDDDVDLF